jgi:hypothetical protein
MKPLELLPRIVEALERHGPDASALAKEVSKIIPADRSAFRRDLFEALRCEMWPEPSDLTSQARLAIIAWHCLPARYRT